MIVIKINRKKKLRKKYNGFYEFLKNKYPEKAEEYFKLFLNFFNKHYNDTIDKLDNQDVYTLVKEGYSKNYAKRMNKAIEKYYEYLETQY